MLTQHLDGLLVNEALEAKEGEEMHREKEEKIAIGDRWQPSRKKKLRDENAHQLLAEEKPEREVRAELCFMFSERQIVEY